MESDRKFEQVKAAINALDPEGLLAMGAPSDEYEPEAAIFVDLIRSGQRITSPLVKQVWIGRFYPECGLVTKGAEIPLAEALSDIALGRP